jgi:hypothetical protein
MNISARTAMGVLDVAGVECGIASEVDYAVAIISTLANIKANSDQNVVGMTFDLDGANPDALLNLCRVLQRLG